MVLFGVRAASFACALIAHLSSPAVHMMLSLPTVQELLDFADSYGMVSFA